MTDAQLLEKLKKRSRSSLETAIRRFNAYVCTVIFNTGGNSLTREDMEELADDVFLALWNNAGNINESLKAYIGATARNMTIGKLRSLKPEEELPEDCAAAYGDPEDAAVKNELSRMLYDEIINLGRPDSEIFLRYYYNGQKLREIAAELGLSVSNVKMKLMRGRSRLKDAFSGKEVL